MIKWLFDHEQVEIVEHPQMLLIPNGVGAVGIDGKEDFRVAAPRLSDDIDIPARFDLELNSLVTLGQVSIHPSEKLIESRLDAEAHTYGHARPGSTD